MECLVVSVKRTINVVNDGFETIVHRYCQNCGKKEINLPSVATPNEGITVTGKIFKINASLIYHCIIEDYGIRGLKRLQGILGIKPMGGYKFGRYLKYLYSKMDTHYDNLQKKIYEKIRKYYKEELDTVPDENGILNVDISFDGTWMKRGHVSNVGMGVVIEFIQAL